ncbi:hypothetical protein [Brevundimonas lenta]|uniref:Uncharacterized protein n=1 Tax=Brevundimonas lenta TaxID=424796 RepID=A0A7W6JEI4_9CAUL|nr:hypothetical protein [Brevundimonas lenta]MBB4083649.1 hypothetical protein [Brevundimonas lenta]
MTDDRNDHEPPLGPFPTHRPESPFPPLGETLPPGVTMGGPVDPPSDWMETANAHDLPTRENALVALGRYAFPPAPPLDDEGVAARDQRWTSRTIVVTTVFLLIFNAVSPLNWSRQQPPGWVPETVQALSQVWSDQLAVFGVDKPRQGVREAWKSAQAARFVGQEPTLTGADAAP